MPHATRDDLSLYYEQAGSGDPAFVFVHGWCCDHTFFEPQYEHLQGDLERRDVRPARLRTERSTR